MSKRSILYLVLVLCVGVMERELPECVSLEDDVSNRAGADSCVGESAIPKELPAAHGQE